MTNFYISISNGLLHDMHRKRMGEAVWEFMWLIDKITKIDSNGDGHVLGGKPILLEEIALDLGVHFNTVSRNLSALEKQGYISKIRTPKGISIKVKKAKKRFTKSVKGITKSVSGITIDGESNIRHYKDNNKDIIQRARNKQVTGLQKVVNFYLKTKSIDLKAEKQKILYSRFVRAAKELLTLCDGIEEQAIFAIKAVENWARKNSLEWSLETVIKKYPQLNELSGMIDNSLQSAKLKGMTSVKDILGK